MKGYKAFRKGLVCMGKQYKENTVFEEEKAEPCKCGMHFCKNPLDVLNFYPLVDEDGNISEFAEVEALDECKTDDDIKFCTTKLKIGAKIGFPQLVQAAVNFEMEKQQDESKIKTTSIDYAKIGSFDYHDNIGSSGDSAQIGSSGDWAQIGSSGNSAKIGSSGDAVCIGSSGDWAKIGSSGDWAKIGSSGDAVRIGCSGDSAQIGSSGDYARIGSSGNWAQIGSSGNSVKIGSSGDYAKIISNGQNSVICCVGYKSVAKAKIGSWIILAEWKYDQDKAQEIPVCVKAVQVDGKSIKEDVFYRLENGKFVEAVL